MTTLGSTYINPTGNTIGSPFSHPSSANLLGPELIVNGSFEADSDWTKGTGWTIADGKASQSTTESVLSQDVLTDGVTYYVSYDIVEISAGAVKVDVGASSGASFQSSVGHYIDTLVCAGGTTVEVGSNSSLVGSVDNVSVREVL